MQRFIFPLGLFLSAALLFMIQPMVAKILLPTYGGAPAVWTVCLLFFQLILLLSYGYVWALSRISNPLYWRLTHLALCAFSLFTFPYAFTPLTRNTSPEINILLDLITQLGLPLFIIGASSPLLQHAYSQTHYKRSADPYFLYTASNIGSLLALLCYPYFLERFWGVRQQLFGWNVGYMFYLIVLISLLCFQTYHPLQRLKQATVHAKSLCFFWIFQSFIACGLMLGVTFYISTDVAATPLFWVLPLALYLLSFIMTFAKKPLLSHRLITKIALFFLLLPIVGFIIGEHQMPAWQLIIANILSFFILSLLCHGELVRTRPAASHLTLFYFCMAIGGVLAGLFNGILAPRIFSHTYEYPLLLLFASFCLPFSKYKTEGITPLIILLLLSIDVLFFHQAYLHTLQLVCLLIIMLRLESKRSLFASLMIILAFIFPLWGQSTHILSQVRNFYGVKQVISTYGTHILISQNTAHGFQMIHEEGPMDGARAYYGPVLPVVKQLQKTQPQVRAMVLGLGTGIMACQFRKQDQLTMVEIDEQVIKIASDPRLFTYLQDCPPDTQLIQKDGRFAVEDVDDHSKDLLVLDAFQSDAVPIHLLTLEAFQLYQQKITSSGLILVNITNRHLRILPVLTASGRMLDMIVLHKQQAANPRLGQLASEWALLTSNETLVDQLLIHENWRFVTDTESHLWTNDYSNIIPLFRWRGKFI